MSDTKSNFGSGRKVQRYGALSSLTQSCLSSLLRLPAVAAPTRAATESPPVVAAEPNALREAAVLLSKVGNRYLRPLTPQLAGDEGYTDLQKSLAELDPKAFSLQASVTAEPAVEATPGLPLTSITSAQTTKAVELQVPHRAKRQRLLPDQNSASHPGAVQAAIDKFLGDRGLHHGEIGNHAATAKDLFDLGNQLSRHQSQVREVPRARLAALVTELAASVTSGQGIHVGPSDAEDSEAGLAAIHSLDACVVCLAVMAAGALQHQDTSEELVAGLADVLKKNLLLSCQPGLPSSPNPKGLHHSRSRDPKGELSGVRLAISAIKSRLQKALRLMAAFLAVGRIEELHLIPLVRAAARAFGFHGSEMLQLAAADLVVAAFVCSPEYRDSIFEDVLSVTAQTGGPSQAGKSTHTSSLNAAVLADLVVRLIQESSRLPKLDGNLEEWQAPLLQAMQWADYFWRFLFNRLPSAKSSKADSDVDIKASVIQVIKDLLTIYFLPELPAAVLLLKRLHMMLGGPTGIGHPEASVRLICVELLGQLGARLFFDARSLDDLEQVTSPDDPHGRLQVLLDSLNSCSGAQDSLRASAQRFRLCQWAADELHCQQGAAAPAKDVVATEFAALLDLCRPGRKLDPEAAGASRSAALAECCRQLKGVRSQTLKWLQSCIEAKDSGPLIRAKAVKSLSAFIRADSRLLANRQVAACFDSALKDESSSVRQESLNLLGLHMRDSSELADAYLETLANAAADQSVAVKKLALKIMWEAFVDAPNSAKAAEACILVLRHAIDPEGSVQEQVAKHCHDLWFTPITGAPDEEPVRVRRLVDIVSCMILGDGSRQGPAVLPLTRGHILLDALGKALEQEDKPGDRLSSGQALADSLLQGLLATQEDAEDRPECKQEALAYILALHVLALSERQFCTPSDKPTKFVVYLAPYLKLGGHASANAGEQHTRAEADQLICVLAILGAIIPGLRSLPTRLVGELEADLMALVRGHAFRTAVAAACETLCHLHVLDGRVGLDMTQLASRYLHLIDECRDLAFPTEKRSAARRCLFVLGQILRHGTPMVEAHGSVADPQGESLTADRAFRSIASICTSRKADAATREQAVRALGAIGLAHPQLLHAAEGHKVLSAALSPGAHHGVQHAALGILLDLLKSEEGEVVELQRAMSSKSGGKLSRGRKKAEAAARLAQQNGEGDALSVCGAILQENMGNILQLLTSTDVVQREGKLDSIVAARTRHGALQIVEAIERIGILPPWTFVPKLVALSTDPCGDCWSASLALRVLSRIAAKHPDMLLRSVGASLDEAASFQQQLRGQKTDDAPSSTTAQHAAAVGGLCSLFAKVLNGVKGGKMVLLAALARRLEAACELPAAKDTAMGFDTVCLYAEAGLQLPLAKMSEACALVQPLAQHILLNGDAVLGAIGSWLDVSTSPGPAELLAIDSIRRLSAAFVVVLRLCRALIAKYSVPPDRLAAHQPNGPARRVDERLSISANAPADLDSARLRPCREVAQLREQYAEARAHLQDLCLTHAHLVDGGTAEQAPEEGMPAAKLASGAGLMSGSHGRPVAKSRTSLGLRGSIRGKDRRKGGRSSSSKKRKPKFSLNDDCSDEQTDDDDFRT